MRRSGRSGRWKNLIQGHLLRACVVFHETWRCLRFLFPSHLYNNLSQQVDARCATAFFWRDSRTSCTFTKYQSQQPSVLLATLHTIQYGDTRQSIAKVKDTHALRSFTHSHGWSDQLLNVFFLLLSGLGRTTELWCVPTEWGIPSWAAK